jgi:threonine dehydratase
MAPRCYHRLNSAERALHRGDPLLVPLVAEPGGAAAFAALLSGAYAPADGERVGVVVSGGNSVAVDFGRA